jgi:hypothetical protein
MSKSLIIIDGSEILEGKLEPLREAMSRMAIARRR